jgi:hypothetical protein
MISVLGDDAVSQRGDGVLLGETAVAETALDSGVDTDEVLAFETATTPNTVPTLAVLDEEEMVAELAALADDPAALAEFLQEHVTDEPSFVTFLRAVQRACVEAGLGGCDSDLEAASDGARTVADGLLTTYGALASRIAALVVPGSSLFALLAANPALATNALALVLGILEGLGDSGVVSADALSDVVAANAALAVLMPLHSACFLAGTVAQVLTDLYDIASLVVAAVGFADELVPLACRLAAALPAALGRLLDEESADVLAELGNHVGRWLATSLREFLPSFDDSDSYATIAAELVRFGFDCGRCFGPFLLDIVLSVVGIGYVEGVLRILTRGATVASSAIDWLFGLLRELFDAVDPGLFDELIALGARINGALDAKLASFALAMEKLHGVPAADLDEGVAVLREALGDDGLRNYAGSFLCNLDGS